MKVAAQKVVLFPCDNPIELFKQKNLVRPGYLLGLRAVNNRWNPLSWQHFPEKNVIPICFPRT